MRPLIINALRASLRAMEADHRRPEVLSLGTGSALDRLLPYGRVHEFGGGAATLFIVLVLAHTRGGILWCAPDWSRNDLYPPGLAQLGLDPDRVILARLSRSADLLHAAHEGLRAGWQVVLELDKPLGLTPARHLQLAAESGGSLGLVTCADPHSREDLLISATTRWACAMASDTLWPAPLCLDLRLVRNRGGLPGQWCVEWNHASRSLSVVSAAGHREDRAPQSAIA